MTVTAPALRSAAALAAAVPGLTCRVTTATGEQVVAGPADDATLCAIAFRELIVTNDWSEFGEPVALGVDGVDPATGLAARPGERYFVSPLGASATVEALRETHAVPAPFHAMVRGDDALAVAVVRIGHQTTEPVTDAALDDVALNAFSASLVAHLSATLTEANPAVPPRKETP